MSYFLYPATERLKNEVKGVGLNNKGETVSMLDVFFKFLNFKLLKK
jgi:hypothetical protein